MGACRFWVYVIAGATGGEGLNGYAIFGGVALAIYVVGLNCIARRGSPRQKIPVWPLALLAAPVVVALMINAGEFRSPAIWISLVLGLWIARCGQPIFMRGDANAGLIVANLLAGIALVDWLAVAPQLPPWLSTSVFLALLGVTKWLQKFAPAA